MFFVSVLILGSTVMTRRKMRPILDLPDEPLCYIFQSISTSKDLRNVILTCLRFSNDIWHTFCQAQNQRNCWKHFQICSKWILTYWTCQSTQANLSKKKVLHRKQFYGWMPEQRFLHSAYIISQLLFIKYFLRNKKKKIRSPAVLKFSKPDGHKSLLNGLFLFRGMENWNTQNCQSHMLKKQNVPF